MFYLSILIIIGLISHVHTQLQPVCVNDESSVPLSVIASKQTIQDAAYCADLSDAGYCINHSELFAKHCQSTVLEISDQMKTLDVGHTKIKFCTDIKSLIESVQFVMGPIDQGSKKKSIIQGQLLYCAIPFFDFMAWSAIKPIITAAIPSASEVTEAHVLQHQSLKVATGTLFLLYVVHKEAKFKLPYGKFLDTLLPTFCNGYRPKSKSDISCDAFVTEFFEVLLPKIIPMLIKMIQKGPQTEKVLVTDVLDIFQFFLDNNSLGITNSTVIKKFLKPLCSIEEFELFHAIVNFLEEEKCDASLITAKATKCYQPLETIDVEAKDDVTALKTEILHYMDQIKTCQDFITQLGCYSPQTEVFFDKCQHVWYNECALEMYPSYKDSLATYSMKVQYRHLGISAQYQCCIIPDEISSTIEEDIEPPVLTTTTQETTEPAVLTTTTHESSKSNVTDTEEQIVTGQGNVYSDEGSLIEENKVPESHTSNAFDSRLLPTVLLLFIVLMVTLH